MCIRDSIEVVQIEYDANIVSYDALLDMFFKIHDPTTIDRQGPDVGEQYKSVIFYANQDEMNAANKKIKIIDAGNFFNDPIVTEVREAAIFYKAEEYHQDFYKKQSMRYKMYAQASGRKGFLEETWKED